jgi:hypothetical protein
VQVKAEQGRPEDGIVGHKAEGFPDGGHQERDVKEGEMVAKQEFGRTGKCAEICGNGLP